jgi:alkaline phosphatase
MVSGQFGSGNLPYERDWLSSLPHLSQMTEAALQILAPATNGFFLMVEGGSIDHACHANNITNCVREVAEFDNAVRMAVNWAGGRSDTFIMVTADHETGGLSVLADEGAGKEPRVSWSTNHHTGANVGVFARGVGAGMVTGVIDNTDIYRIVMRSQPIDPLARGIDASAGSGIRTRWDAKPGDVCRLEATDSLTETNWAPLATVTTSTHVVILTDTNTPSGGARFYRLISVR